MAYSPTTMACIAQGPRKLWMYVSADAQTYDADAYFADDRLSVGDIIIATRSGTVTFVLLQVTAKSAAGVCTVAKESNPTLG